MARTRRSPGRNDAAGGRAERVACDHLERAGLRTVCRNYRTPFGELDLVMRDDDTLVVVEVRHRSRSDFGRAAETVDHRKRARLTRATAHFLQRHPGDRDAPLRFDVVALEGPLEDPGVIWLRDAFAATD